VKFFQENASYSEVTCFSELAL